MGPCSVFSTAGCVALCYVPNWSRTDIVSVLTICLIALVIVTARGEPRLSSGREELCLETITGRHCSHLIILRELRRKAHLENHLLRLSLGVLTLNTELQKYSDISDSQKAMVVDFPEYISKLRNCPHDCPPLFRALLISH